MKKTLVLALACLAVAVSCKEQVEPSRAPKAKQAVKISPVISRVTETTFERGDAIGLNITLAGESYATNERLAYDGSVFVGELDWYDESLGASDLLAYYPYSETAPSRFTVQADQTAGLSASDFVAASASGVEPSESPVSMTFTHRLSRLEIVVANNSGKEFGALKIGNVVPEAVLDASFVAAADGSAAKVQISPYPSGGKFYAIIPPQAAALTVSFTLDGQQKEFELVSATFGAGKQNTVNVTIETEAISVTLAGIIQNWEQEDYSNRQIHYTSTDGNIVTPYKTDVFGANIVSNVYENGEGVICFDADVTSIGQLAFYRCTTLSGITIPASVTEIGGYAFQICSALTEITLPEALETIGYGAFAQCTALSGTITIPQSVTSIREGIFTSCSAISAFAGKYASAEGKMLIAGDVLIAVVPGTTTEWDIPSGIKRIGDKVFYANHSVVRVGIPEGVQSIGERAFSSALNLRAVTLPSTITRLDYGAFESAISVPDVTILAITPPTLDTDVFEAMELLGRIIVPAGTVSAYKDAWPSLAGMIYGADDPGFSAPVAPDVVDLGLSVKWAAWNLGATSKEQAGYYYAWGETEPKYCDSRLNYKWGVVSNYDLTGYTKYARDGKTVLESTDDAATVNLGGDWRIPTADEWDELRNGCAWLVTTINGVKGYQITSKTNSRYIFLPITGTKQGGTITKDTDGYYWASELFGDDYIYGRTFRVSTSSSSATHSSYGNPRQYGLCIRAVTP